MTKTTPGAMRATPGPWEAREIAEGHWDIFPVGCSHDRVPIAVLNHSRDGHELTRTVMTPADARLIAASPEMLEALQLVVEDRIDHIRPNLFGCNECRQSAKLRAQIPHRELCHVGKCEAAIAAATGEGKIG